MIYAIMMYKEEARIWEVRTSKMRHNPKRQEASCIYNVFWDSLRFDSGCVLSLLISVVYFVAYYGLRQYYLNMHARIHK